MKAVLFVLIGWAIRYDGTELIRGGHRYLKRNPERSSEQKAFLLDDDGQYRCGVGYGQIYEDKLDVIFVAKNPDINQYQIIGYYTNPSIEGEDKWKTASSKKAHLYPPEKRPKIAWPFGQGMRRWAIRKNGKGNTSPSLLKYHYRSIRNHRKSLASEEYQSDIELSAFEGERKNIFIAHRKREAKLRSAKIQDTLNKTGSLKCEVNGCGFDFREKYGDLGAGFAIVHHLKPLSKISKNGKRNSVSDLAIVCANCHAMIHRDGGCRKLDDLIKKRIRARKRR